MERLRREHERLRQELEERAKQIADQAREIDDVKRQLALRQQNSTFTSKPPSSDGLASRQRLRSRRMKSRRKHVPQEPQPTMIAFTNVNVIPLDSERIDRGRTVVVRAGRIVSTILGWRAKVNSGKILGPTIYTAGPFVNEPRARTPEEGERNIAG